MQIVRVLETNYVTHDVKRFVLEKPQGFTFISGQATDVSINLPNWENELRPFTFTSLNEWDFLEFTIKIYEHEGVTHQLGKINRGSELILHDVFGTIQYQGKGIFIAGGAGITPFISILRNLYKNGEIIGNKLFFSNKTSSDVILEEELSKMLENNFIKIFTREKVAGHINQRIDKNFLMNYIADFNQHFYVCGPDEFVKDITSYLADLGAPTQTVVFEK